MRGRKLTTAVALAAAALAALLVFWRWPSQAPEAIAPGAASAAFTLPGGAAASATAASAPLPSELGELVAYLRARFGKHLANRYVQIQMLEKLMRHFQAKNPAGWQAELLAALRAAFPERADELAANLERRLAYEDWLAQHKDRLAGLGERERRDALWEARKRLFGEDAAEEIWASERKNQAVSDALAEIDARPDATVSDRLAQFRDSLLDVHQEHTDAFLQNRRQEAVNRFLALDSVQRELASLPPAERATALREVRKGLGLDDAALGRWDSLDQERDRRWEAGRAYMTERAELAKQHAGEALEARLAELRARYFGAEAATIADEEAAGFFRFDRPRRYGFN
jgi:hypothetical protein